MQTDDYWFCLRFTLQAVQVLSFLRKVMTKLPSAKYGWYHFEGLLLLDAGCAMELNISERKAYQIGLTENLGQSTCEIRDQSSTGTTQRWGRNLSISRSRGRSIFSLEGAMVFSCKCACMTQWISLGNMAPFEDTMALYMIRCSLSFRRVQTKCAAIQCLCCLCRKTCSRSVFYRGSKWARAGKQFCFFRGVDWQWHSWKLQTESSAQCSDSRKAWYKEVGYWDPSQRPHIKKKASF